jgi:hypothetical protein
MKTSKQSWNCAAIVAAAVFLLHVPVTSAQSDSSPQDSPAARAAQAEPDPPSRVARLDYMDGALSFQPAGEQNWMDAELNRPLISGDNLWADENSRAEIHVGSTALRLGPKTGITLLEVSDHAAQIRLAEGSLIVNVRHVDADDTYEIDTPNIAFVVTQPGDYRIDVDPDTLRTDVAVWRGRGEVTGAGVTYPVLANQYATFTGDDRVAYEAGQIPTGDGLDNWASERDRNEDAADSANYVSRDMTGYEDLDSSGDWSYVAAYGYVWRPRGLTPGWAPYRNGHWAYVGQWGWTWVAQEPWGFAPFHYGRWAFAGNNWVWVPGPNTARPIYAPALVAWVGGKPNAKFSFGAGVGWVPLAPGEVFVPGYRVSHGYVNRVNTANTAVNVTRVANVYDAITLNRSGVNLTYANRGANGGVTVVSRETFVNAQPVARGMVSLPARELETAAVGHAIEVEPTHASVTGSGAPVANRPPAAATTRTVVALRTPAPMPRSFGAGVTNSNVRVAGQPANAEPMARQQSTGNSAQQAPAKHQFESDDFHSSAAATSGNNQARPQPHVWEAQGTPEPERKASKPAASRNVSRSTSSSTAKTAAPVQPKAAQPQQEEKVEYSSWHQGAGASSTKSAVSSTTSASSTHPQSSHSSTPVSAGVVKK